MNVPQGQPDPQTTNIPYVAWTGEQVKVVKCFGSADGVSEATPSTRAAGCLVSRADRSAIEDWSGDHANDAGPAVMNDADGSVVGQRSDGRLCFSFEVTSQKPGLAVYQAAVNNRSSRCCSLGTRLISTSSS